MRVKMDARRRAIIDDAGVIFRECGYERASMSQIAARVGGSKATLYGYFKSKQELFMAVMTDAVECQSDALFALIDMVGDDPAESLRAFGRSYLDLVLTPDINAVTRIGIAEGHDATIGGAIYELGPRRGWLMMAEHLQGWIDRGLLRQADSRVVALHLRALLEAGIVEPTLFGAAPHFEREAAVTQAVDAFLRAYGTNPKE